ncbi:hypothetical protein SAMN05428981_110126 [Bacillus sp. OV194]|nr:hypothetical protein SAMN05428981_110126 [Bacillus sp. OV194]
MNFLFSVLTVMGIAAVNEVRHAYQKKPKKIKGIQL